MTERDVLEFSVNNVRIVSGHHGYAIETLLVDVDIIRTEVEINLS